MPGAALVFLAVTTELTATLLLAPIGTQTLATQFWSNSTSIAYGAAAPYAALIVLISLPATFLLTREARRSTDLMTALTLRGVTKSFGATTVLHGVDLDVPARELTAILGPSGCGKTTLLRLIAGFLDPDAGTIAFGDQRGVRDRAARVPPQRRRVGYVPQEGALFPHLDVAGNIAFGMPRGARRQGTARRRAARRSSACRPP